MNAEDSAKLYTFYETPVFTAKLAQVAGENALPILYAIQADLIANPLRWPVVKGTGARTKDVLPIRGVTGARAVASAICIFIWNIAVRFTCSTCSPNQDRPI